MSIAVVAEKPAVARDIAKVLKADKQGRGYLHGGGYIITWAIGHLVGLAEPHIMNARWKTWRKEYLPMLPAEWKLSVLNHTKNQFEIVKKIINSQKVDSIICATDAGREGELIFTYIYKAAGCKKPVDRLWISSLTPEAISNGFGNLRRGEDYEPLASAAIGRSRADWLVGLNLSRAYSLIQGESLSVGRVQTPTLAMLVEREIAIQGFTPQDYIEVEAQFSPAIKNDKPDNIEEITSYKGKWFQYKDKNKNPSAESAAKNMRLSGDGNDAGMIIDRVKTGNAKIKDFSSKLKQTQPPIFYDLSDLQRDANRLYGFSAKKTLDLAQKLYEEKKLLSYPRTDSRYLTKDVSMTLGKIVNCISGPYREHFPFDKKLPKLGKRFVNDAKVTDHHAIIPTAISSIKISLSPDEEKIYDLVCRRLLSAWLDNFKTRITTVITEVSSSIDKSADPIKDLFHTKGVIVKQMGWKALEIRLKNPAKTKETSEGILPSCLEKNQEQKVVLAQSLKKKTRPPVRFTDATLLTAMETAGKILDDKALTEAMKEKGLGTPATRAAIFETLIKRELIMRKRKTLEPTEKGIRLINMVHPDVKSPIMTGTWEQKLKQIERGHGDLDKFMQEIEAYVSDVVGKAFALNNKISDRVNPPSFFNEEIPAPTDEDYYIAQSFLDGPQSWANEDASLKITNEDKQTNKKSVRSLADKIREDKDPDLLKAILVKIFDFDSFRPFQQKVCESVVKGEDALLVMPTGAGKSLCYQLPGIARGGTTLVISPLIALMEDQVKKLKEIGLIAERIHSGRSNFFSRQACVDYLDGRLDYLFIAPERLGVKGFSEMLATRKPSLIAIDEAHCISQWGHDFRPDYRLMGERLPILRPSPILAMTATATTLVQEDIIQLLLHGPKKFIHGFRRTNIAIEVVKLAPGERDEAIQEILRDQASRPAIIYTSTRKKAEAMSNILKTHFTTAAYHAGLMPKIRNEVQSAFLSGRLEVIVATIAFGMGIDKPDIRTVAHMALPASLEAYYQEIGRAGRDGKMSRAILFYSYADCYMHLFFHKRNYPDPSLLQEIYNQLKDTKESKETIRNQVKMTEDEFAAALEKLLVHGGALIDSAENIKQGHNHWHDTYKDQSSHKLNQLNEIIRWAESYSCRMLQLIRHFGDTEDNEGACGLCDYCAPNNNIFSKIRSPNEKEAKIISAIISFLKKMNNIGTGALYNKICSDGLFSRTEYEQLLNGLFHVELINLTDHSFNKNGKTINYRKAAITTKGYSFKQSETEHIILTGKAPESKKKARSIPRKGKDKRSEISSAIDPKIYEVLKEWRLKEAKKIGIPAFRIFSNRTLNQMASDLPRDEKSLLAIHGIGPISIDKYGKQILEIISKESIS